MLMKFTKSGGLHLVLTLLAWGLLAGNASLAQAPKTTAEPGRIIDLDFEVWEADQAAIDDWEADGKYEGHLVRMGVLGSFQEFQHGDKKPKFSPPSRFSLRIKGDQAHRLQHAMHTSTLRMDFKLIQGVRDEMTLDYEMVRQTTQGEVKVSASQSVKFGHLLMQWIKPKPADDKANQEMAWLVFISPRQRNADGSEVVVSVDAAREVNPFGVAFLPRPGRFEMQVSEGWSGLLMANSMVGQLVMLSGTTNVGKSKDARASDNHVRLEVFQAERPVVEVVYTDDGFIEVVARRAGVAALTYQATGLDGKAATCDLQIVVAADTTEIDRTIHEVLPQARINVTNIKDAALLTGTVANEDDIKLLLEVAEQYYPKIINRVKIAPLEANRAKGRPGDLVNQPTGVSATTQMSATSLPAPGVPATDNEPRRSIPPTNGEARRNRPPRPDAAELKALHEDVRGLRDDVRRLSELLEKRLAQGNQPPSAKKYLPKVQAALQKPVSLDLQAAPLRDVIRTISEIIGVNCVLDPQSLEEAGRTPTDLVTITIKDISARSALQLILEPLNLAFVAEDEVLKIVSRQRAKGVMTIVTYAVADLVFPLPGEPGDRTIPETANWMKLIDQITEIKPDQWKANGGPCSVDAIEKILSLVIRATPGMHQSVADLLNRLRRDQDVQITVAISLLQIADDSKLQKAGLKFVFDPRTGAARLNDREAKQLIAAHHELYGDVLFAPKITSFSGQIAQVRFDVSRDPIDMLPGFQVHVRGQVAKDGSGVRLNVAFNPESLINELIRNSHVVPDGGYLLFDMTDRLSPPKQDADSNGGIEPRAKPKGRVLVLVQPGIIVAEEE